MKRITHRTAGCAKAPPACVHMTGGFAQGEVIERLALYEDLCEELQARQQALALQMETLRAEGREKSVKFRELFAQKLTNAAFLSVLQAKGLL
jgi:hypothetical protein